MAGLRAECVLESRCELGEGPLWNPLTGRLDFVDITACALHSFDPRTGRHDVRDLGEHVGSFAPRRDGGYVVAVQTGFGVLEVGAQAIELVAPVLADDPAIRMNDGKCDRDGSFWAGSMAYDFAPGAASLWRLDPDGSVHTMVEGVTISNGIDWTEDGSTMYYIDSMAYGVDAFDVVDGGIVNRRRAIDVGDPGAATLVVPDGMTVDAEGALWVAVHGAGEVRRLSPGGDLLEVVELPSRSVTSVAFGGDRLDQLYITCAGGDRPGAADDGGIFRCVPGVTGRPANLFAG